jgi:hypothetical protein
MVFYELTVVDRDRRPINRFNDIFGDTLYSCKGVVL